MSIVSARSTRPSRWTAARVSVVWRSFDLQLATYAALLLCFAAADNVIAARYKRSLS